MKKTNSPKILMAAACMTLASTFGMAQEINVLAVKTDLDTTHIIVPESFEVDTHNLIKDWYLTRYAVMDTEADSRPSIVLTDDEYIERLQKIPATIEMPFNNVVKSFINMYVERRKMLVESMLGLSIYYMPMFEDAFEKYGLPLELKNLAIIESALNPNAVSKAGATGLWQFMASTAQGEGLEINSLVDERRDPHKSTEAAARLLKKLFDTYSDWSLAIAAYNCGPGNVNKAIRRAGGGKKDFWEIYNFLPAETRSYVPAFIAANYAMTYYGDHNISPVLASKPVVVDSVQVNKRVHFQQISDVLGIPIEEIRALNPQYRVDLIPGDIKPYTLVLPHLQTLCYISYEDSIVNHNAELYARRDVVEPGLIKKVTGSDGVEYVEQTVVKYHKVARGETLASVARKYGVTQAEVKRANGGRKSLQRGKTLAINVVERREVPVSTQAQADSTAVATPSVNLSEPSDTVSSTTQTTEQPDTVKIDKPISAAAKQVSEAMGSTNRKKNTDTSTASNTVYTVKGGDNLFKIASKYGITVDQLKKANNLTNDKIQPGQKLKIPAKVTRRKSSRR